MARILIVIDMQKDFIDGSLGTPEAVQIVKPVKELVNGWDGRVLFTAAGVVPAGEFVNVRITGIFDGDLTGEIEE